jgi:FkbM family methyltransferase
MNIPRIVLKPFLGKRQLQFIFEAMHKVGMAGMNIGEGGMPDQSGEEWVLQFIKSRFASSSDMTVFDVGANVGQFAENVVQGLGPATRIWSFEPTRSAYSVLTKNIERHKNITAINAAVGSEIGKVEMFSPVPNSKLASIYSRPLTWENREKPEVVECITIDDFAAKQNVQQIHFLKIDVEGHELAVLKGAGQMIKNGKIDVIQFEFSAAHIDARVFFRDIYLLLNPNFELFRILQNGLSPILTYKPELEQFKRATNYLAIRRSNT